MSRSADILRALATEVGAAPDEPARREAFARHFGALRAHLDLHPRGSRPSVTFEGAAQTTREIAADCLPLGVGLVMHLYPLCALRCVPLPWWSPARARRARLLRAIDARGLLLANAGSERAAGVQASVRVARTSWGLRVDGTYDYVSLANVADLVLFTAPVVGSDHTMFCVASLRAASTSVGAPKFGGSMRLSDTCPVTFDGHLIPPGRHLEVPGRAALSCMAQYQRSWFQLLLCEAYLARISRLRASGAAPSIDDLARLNELSLLREFALRLLHDPASTADFAQLARITDALKLRVSWMAQATALAILPKDPAAAGELGYLRRQPTSDDRIIHALVNSPRSVEARAFEKKERQLVGRPASHLAKPAFSIEPASARPMVVGVEP